MRFLLLAALWLVALSPWPLVPASAQEKSSAEAAQEASEKAEKADQESEGPRRRDSRILMPGGAPRGGPPPAKAPADAQTVTPIPPPAGNSAPAPQAERAPGWSEAPAAASSAPPAQTTGDLFWNGRIYKNGRIRISVGNETTAGYVEGDPLPGVAAVVDARSPVVEIIEQPSARNGFKSFEFRVKKTNKKPVTLNFHWAVKP